MASFSKVVFHDTEVIWEELFRKMGKQYQKPVLVLYSGQVDSACGMAESAVGPFYCPGDSRVYIDLSFYRDMQRKLNAPGEFARAYVLAHEVGHHVQRQLGYSQREDEARQRPDKAESNKMSIRHELQADFFAGVWAHHAQKKFEFLEKGDMESSPQRRLRDRRRPAPEEGPGLRRPGFVHPRHVQATHALVHKGLREGRGEQGAVTVRPARQRAVAPHKGCGAEKGAIPVSRITPPSLRTKCDTKRGNKEPSAFPVERRRITHVGGPTAAIESGAAKQLRGSSSDD